jgi:hypothetical protein
MFLIWNKGGTDLKLRILYSKNYAKLAGSYQFPTLPDPTSEIEEEGEEDDDSDLDIRPETPRSTACDHVHP